MTSFKLFIATIIISIASAIPVDPGISAQDRNQGNFKEVTLYLTPSQIKAFEASQGKNVNQDQISEEDLKILEAEIKRQLEGHDIYTQNQYGSEKVIANYHHQPPLVEEPIQENPQQYSPQYQQKWIPISQQQEGLQQLFSPTEHHQPIARLPQSYSYIKFFTDKDVHETPKLQLFHPIPHEHEIDPELAKFLEIQRDPLHHKQYRLIPYEYSTTPEPPKYEYQKVEIPQWSSILEKYNQNQNIPSQAQQLAESLKDQNQNLEQFEKDLSELKYAPQFGDHKQTADDDNFHIKIEKENALARAEAIFKSTPESVHKNIKIPIFPSKHFNRPSALYFVKDTTNYFHRFRALDVKRNAPSKTSAQKTILYPVRKQ